MRFLQRTPPFIAAAACVVLCTACLSRTGRRSLLVNSEPSDYSPVISFQADVRVADSVRVRIPGARLFFPGERLEGTGAVTGRIDMQALLVTVNPAAAGGSEGSVNSRNGTRKPWMERSASALVKLSDSLHYGEPQQTGALQFTLALPADVGAADSWLVFRLTGPSVSMPARMADGSVMDSGISMPPIRVFACAVRNLDGKTNKARQRTMAEGYSAGC